MKKLLLIPLLALAACGGSSAGVTTTDDDVICYGEYSYLEIAGQIVPSPSTLAGDIDIDCYLPS